MSLWEEGESGFDDHFNVRAPKALRRPIEEIKKDAGLRSINLTRVRAMSMGVEVYRWILDHRDDHQLTRRVYGLLEEEVVKKLLELGAEAMRDEAKRKGFLKK